MIYEEPEQKHKKHNKKTVHILVDYIKGNDERIAKNLINYSAGGRKEFSKITEFIYANNIIHIPNEARIASGELLDLSAAIAEMQQSIALKPSVKQQFKHMIVSLDTGENLSNPQWQKTVKRLMEHLGYDNCRYISFKHNDTDEEHVHIVTSTIDMVNRKKVSDSYSYYRAQEVMRELEIEFGLRQLVSSIDICYDDSSSINDARVKTKKAQVARLISRAINRLNHCSTLAEFVFAVEKQHPDLKVEVREKDGRASGLIFTFSDNSFSASQLGGNRKFTLGKLIKNGILSADSLNFERFKEEINKSALLSHRQKREARTSYVKRQSDDNGRLLVLFTANKIYFNKLRAILQNDRFHLRSRIFIQSSNKMSCAITMQINLVQLSDTFSDVLRQLFIELFSSIRENHNEIQHKLAMQTFINDFNVKVISLKELKDFESQKDAEIFSNEELFEYKVKDKDNAMDLIQ
ncbi:relaxase/mobilization nuclease domain-containing protein [Vibrio alginolyticus]|uniref:relaxase/mobilization nuclease domain-containing protein n=1 Tax=Vibrio TaxID=662 RepID=UPI001CDC64B2|nr:MULTISPECIES: relaxase/mobilization nuclease domain-containing protein [Vibrio]MCA2452371.1 relaxase/mobilization nuclease domain-containing protein [Vibrio alginolyticus]MCA2474086.1 relaxase/mobilization nuclease domain-containing protein [Vibrio alginolyticus]MDW2154112.1 relaxase/mobilization nuclease domain-containing protein [Vibrio sp. 2092]MDW2232374.1 relaxase/mobilization nuclease domain-containing protein [Vibrio sp. 2091]